ncbi:UNVERIFIED_CONTAM: tRNA pseudouridine synthase Pus10 [Sesamum radiatum]|uniref:tRNA pseudouridine(55) synthase n=1 Tax=Sesamum radiatum TaxID=300843 RepID=A0AAW2PY81_SESRA
MGEVIKQEGHQIDKFSLEVSLPQDVVENEQAVWLYIKEKYSSESWFLEKFPSECFATKDFLKLSVTNPLETLLGTKSNVSFFRVRLTYTLSDASTRNQQLKEKNGFCKRRKTDDSDNFKKDGGFHRVEGHDLTRKSSTDLEDGRVGLSKFPLEKVNQCCSLNFQCYRTSVYVGGRYLKYSRNVSQTRWIIDDERMGEASIEVKVKNLKVLGNQGWELMREGEAEKQKQYAALVWIPRPLNDDDVQTLSSLKDMKTPIRVLHRRSPLEREKTIHWMRIERIAGSSQYFLLHLCTQAGTYIKEFVHGDLGRTHPSIGSILKCRAEILQLDVTDVKMDCFQARTRPSADSVPRKTITSGRLWAGGATGQKHFSDMEE